MDVIGYKLEGDYGEWRRRWIREGDIKEKIELVGYLMFLKVFRKNLELGYIKESM